MTPIVTFREVIYRMLVETAPVPVYQYLPGSADDLPSIVVGRPKPGPDPDVSAVCRITGDVVALGRRDNDEDAQAELDALGDYLLDRFWAPEPVETLRILLDGDVQPTTVEIAGLVVSSYTAPLIAHFRYCP